MALSSDQWYQINEINAFRTLGSILPVLGLIGVLYSQLFKAISRRVDIIGQQQHQSLSMIFDFKLASLVSHRVYGLESCTLKSESFYSLPMSWSPHHVTIVMAATKSGKILPPAIIKKSQSKKRLENNHKTHFEHLMGWPVWKQKSNSWRPPISWCLGFKAMMSNCHIFWSGREGWYENELGPDYWRGPSGYLEWFTKWLFFSQTKWWWFHPAIWRWSRNCHMPT